MTTTPADDDTTPEDRPPIRGGLEGRRTQPRPGASTGGGSPEPPPSIRDPFEPLIERGVSRAVWEARGCVPYFGVKHPLHDPHAVGDFLDVYALTPGQRGALTRWINRARDSTRSAGDQDAYGDGLLMPKYSVPGSPPVLPQLRPRDPVRTGSRTRHHHSTAFAHVRDLERHLNDPASGHDGIDQTDLHEHENEAKYLITPRARFDSWHDHATDEAFQGTNGAAKLRAHLRSAHGGRPTAGRHKHRRPAPGQHVANRLDIHPWALERLFDAERVYFVLEGTPKADAILTRILADETRASVFNVPSVTLWKAPELGAFAGAFSRLRDPLVVLVVDADWHENERVVRQALLCREFLRTRDVRACISAPPDTRDASGGLLHKGVDDFLAHAGDLDDLQVLDREAPFSLALFAAQDGTISGTVPGLAKILGVRRDAESVVSALDRHIEHGLIEADRPLRRVKDDWSGGMRWEGGRAAWPTFTIPTEYRHEEKFVRLGDYEAVLPASVMRVFAAEVDAARGDAPFPRREYLDTAVEATAKRLGKSPRTIRQASGVQGWYAGHDHVRRLAVMAMPDRGAEVLGRVFGVSASTIKREKRATKNRRSELMQQLRDFADAIRAEKAKANQGYDRLLERYENLLAEAEEYIVLQPEDTEFAALVEDLVGATRAA